MNKNGILFDLDGTLWEVTNRTYESVNQITKKYNLKEITKETVCSIFGLSKEEVAKTYFPYLSLEEALKINNEIEILNSNNLKNMVVIFMKTYKTP